MDSAPDSPEKIYTHIYRAVISYINQKGGIKKIEYSTEEIINIIKSHDCAKFYKEFEQILTRGEAVRFAPVSSQDAQNDVQKMKDLLKKIDHVWS